MQKLQLNDSTAVYVYSCGPGMLIIILYSLSYKDYSTGFSSFSSWHEDKYKWPHAAHHCFCSSFPFNAVICFYNTVSLTVAKHVYCPLICNYHHLRRGRSCFELGSRRPTPSSANNRSIYLSWIAVGLQEIEGNVYGLNYTNFYFCYRIYSLGTACNSWLSWWFSGNVLE